MVKKKIPVVENTFGKDYCMLRKKIFQPKMIKKKFL